MTEERAYPLEIRGGMSPDLSRWLWLVKWLLAIPHWIILFFLGIASSVVWFIAWWAILFTARYPRGMFNFTVGVSRWSWRVKFYACMLGTDRYPPFTLAADVDYPANLSVEYPERLSRIKVIFKWWLLAIPHYIILYFFGGLSAALSIIAGIILLFTGNYRGDVYGALMAVNRWQWRVTGYASFLYDDYPPFEFDTSSG